MKRFYIGMFLVIIAALTSVAQSGRYTIHLKDKKNSPFSIANPSAYLSSKSIERRLRQNIPIDASDLPVNPAYLANIRKIPGVTIINTSKWLNQAWVTVSDTAMLHKINDLPFVSRSTAITLPIKNGRRKNIKAIMNIPETVDTSFDYNKTNVPSFISANINGDSLNYGNNSQQVYIHEGEYLHKLGFRGQGMEIAILDAGFFGYKTNPAFDSVRMKDLVLDEYDFVMNEASVNEDNIHGANCFSIMASNRPGVIVGTAPGAGYRLFRTEDVSSETPVEEQNWIAAAERADSSGADLITSSLGYTNFDDPSYNHSYAQRDGNTAMITIAADFAAKKGMIVVNSAGNSGTANNDNRYIMCPADGDSVVAVGAINGSGNIAGFSNQGPNGAGKIKPNIVSVGWNAVYANPNGTTATGNGTSYAAPNIAGLITCLWQAFPEFNNMEIIDAVEKSAHRYLTPDTLYGYGIPNFRIAYEILEAEKKRKYEALLQQSWITVYPVPFREQFTVLLKAPGSGNVSLRLIDAAGRVLQLKKLQVLENNYYTVQIVHRSVSSGIYYLQYDDGRNRTVVRTAGL